MLRVCTLFTLANAALIPPAQNVPHVINPTVVVTPAPTVVADVPGDIIDSKVIYYDKWGKPINVDYAGQYATNTWSTAFKPSYNKPTYNWQNWSPIEKPTYTYHPIVQKPIVQKPIYIQPPVVEKPIYVQPPVVHKPYVAPMVDRLDPFMLMLLLKDDDSSFSKLLPFLMTNGQEMDPMMLMMLLGDEEDSSTLDNLLPFLFMPQGAGGMDPMMLALLMTESHDNTGLMMMLMNQTPGQQMNPLFLMALLEDECHVTLDIFDDVDGDDFVADDDFIHDLAVGNKFYVGIDIDDMEDMDVIIRGDIMTETEALLAARFIDYEYIHCLSKEDSISSFLPLMLHQNTMTNQGFDPMLLMLMLMSDSSSDSILPLMMMNYNQFPSNQGFNPLMLWVLADNDDHHDSEFCDAIYELDHAIELVEEVVIGGFAYHFEKVTDISDIHNVFENPTVAGYPTHLGDSSYFEDKYFECLMDPDSETAEKSKITEILPLLMMNHGNQIDPMMLTLLLA